MHPHTLPALVCTVALAAATACGGSSPTTSSAPSGPTTSATTTATDPTASNPPPSGGSASSVTLAGFVPGAIPPTGACPAIRFGIESKATGAYVDTVIIADASTSYSGGACGDVTLGVLLEVQGLQQADKSVHATLVKFTPKGAPIRAY